MVSIRNYVTIAEVKEYVDTGALTDAEITELITQAEEIIDNYVGFQQKAVEVEYRGLATGGGATTLTLSTNHLNIFQIDYFKYCIIEIIGGTGIGQSRMITSSTLAGVLTVATWTTNPDITSYYRIYQLGKFPRLEDEHFDGENTPNKYYKFIPEKVKRAVIDQVEYAISVGENFFINNQSDLQSESIGDYSYTKFGNSSTSRLDDLIAPKSKLLLNGIRNIVGEIEI